MKGLRGGFRFRSLLSLLVIGLWLLLLTGGIYRDGFAQDDRKPSEQQEEQTEKNDNEAMGRLGKSEMEDVSIYERFMSIVGLVVFIGLAFAMSVSKRQVRWALVGWGVGLQLIFGLLILKTAPGKWIFDQLTDAVNVLLGFTEEGAKFVFGNLVYSNVPVGQPDGSPLYGPLSSGNIEAYANTGAFFAFNVLPTIIFFSSLMSVLYHLGVMQKLVKLCAFIMQKTLKTSGSESLSAAANIFVGQTEAPLVIRPYIKTMTRSELMAIMTGGFATIAGGVLAAYVGMLRHHFPDIAGHLIAASVMSAPAALVIAKIMIPETEESMTAGKVKMTVEKETVNVIDAAGKGASDGLQLALNVGAMLLAFIALIAMLNYFLSLAGSLVGIENLSLQTILSYLFWPLAWVMGIPASECMTAGRILGEKTVINEFVAYLSLSDVLATGQALSHRSVVILSYALCGFANFGSIAIQLGGISPLAPKRRPELAKLGLRAMIGGTLAAFMTACIAGLLI